MILVKLISRRRSTPSLSFPYLLNIKIALQRNPQSASALIDPNSDLSLSCKKGCRSVNKQFGIDSFLVWEGHRWVFQSSLIFELSLSLNFSFALGIFIQDRYNVGNKGFIQKILKWNKLFLKHITA